MPYSGDQSLQAQAIDLIFDTYLLMDIGQVYNIAFAGGAVVMDGEQIVMHGDDVVLNGDGHHYPAVRALVGISTTTWGSDINVSGDRVAMVMPKMDHPNRPRRGDQAWLEGRDFVIDQVATADNYTWRVVVVEQ